MLDWWGLLACGVWVERVTGGCLGAMLTGMLVPFSLDLVKVVGEVEIGSLGPEVVVGCCSSSSKSLREEDDDMVEVRFCGSLGLGEPLGVVRVQCEGGVSSSVELEREL